VNNMTRTQHHSQNIPLNRTNINIEVDSIPFYVSIAWGWFLFFIPTIIMFIKMYTTHFRIDNNLIIESQGLINKTYKTVDLYRIKNISATYSPVWTGGVLKFELQGNESVTLDLVANPQDVLSNIRQLSLDAKKHQNMTILDY